MQPAIFLEKNRIHSIDILRGIIMVIMALDHVRDFFHADALLHDPTDMDKTSPALFFTRWITHFCAPTFVFLAGTSAFLTLQRKSKRELSGFLLTRGIWLIFLEVVVMRFFLLFNLYYDVTFFTILWVIGWCMIFLSVFIHLSLKWNLILGIVIVVLHNAFDFVSFEPTQILFAPWMIFMTRGFIPVTPDNAIFISYPIIPWLGIMLLGFVAGKLYTDYDASKRQALLIKIGLSLIALFIVLRLINLYGDPAPWTSQKNFLYTFMSFLNASKYPVSLLFTLMTLGPVFLALAALEKVKPQAVKFFHVFGRVPLFYFLLHFLLAHVAALVALIIHTGISWTDIDFHFAKSFGGITRGSGYSLAWVYVAWALIVLALYPVCRWYDRYKSSHRHRWLSYL